MPLLLPIEMHAGLKEINNKEHNQVQPDGVLSLNVIHGYASANDRLPLPAKKSCRSLRCEISFQSPFVTKQHYRIVQAYAGLRICR